MRRVKRGWGFEGAAPAFVSLAGIAPGDQECSTRAISIERSLTPTVSGAFENAIRIAEQNANATPGDPAAATLVGEIYADLEMFAKAAPWWNKIATTRPGVKDRYLESAAVFWDISVPGCFADFGRRSPSDRRSITVWLRGGRDS